jgi:hypothetical protein
MAHVTAGHISLQRLEEIVHDIQTGIMRHKKAEDTATITDLIIGVIVRANTLNNDTSAKD